MGAKKKKRVRSRKSVTPEQIAAASYVHKWAFSDARPPPPASGGGGDFAPVLPERPAERVVFEFHSHSICSDGFLSPAALVERAHRNKVKVLALTDHDTMAGIPEAIEAADTLGIRVIPGVEISTLYSPREESGAEEPVHILAYYGSCGPSRYEELNKLLSDIRDGRYLRAKNMLVKLNQLKMPIQLEHVAKIAGHGVAPGRLHVARAMVEAGYVENLKQAFSKYLYDGGPAYAMGSEPSAEAVVQLICRTGGVSALAHPWALKNPPAVIRSLKAVGLHAMEVYRSDGKLDGFCDLADKYELLKIGGSDYHGKGGHDESDMGSVNLPILAVYEFLKMARPIWCNAVKDILLTFTKEPSDMNFEKISSFGKISTLKGTSASSCAKDVVDLCLSSWLTNEEFEDIEFESIRTKASETLIHIKELHEPVVSRTKASETLIRIKELHEPVASRTKASETLIRIKELHEPVASR